MAYFAGFDGGGTKTACVVGDEQKILGRGASLGSKITRVGPGQARASLRQSLEEACQQARISSDLIQHACIGLAGAARADVADSIRKLMEEIVPCSVEVVGDMVIALEAAFDGGPGAIVIAGTGSICFGRDERGQTARAGGWGSAVSDEGSGDWIGRRAVGAALRAHDAGQNTALLPALMDSWKAGTRDGVATIANSYPPPDFAQLFPRVQQLAEHGDKVAKNILTHAGLELAQMAKIVLRRLWPGPRAVRLCMTGGIFQNSEQVRVVFAETVRSERPETEISFQEVEPVLGALALARKAAPAGKSTAT